MTTATGTSAVKPASSLNNLTGHLGTPIDALLVEDVVAVPDRDSLPSYDSSRKTGGSDSTAHCRNERKSRSGTCCNTEEGVDMHALAVKTASSPINLTGPLGTSADVAPVEEVDAMPDRDTISRVMTARGKLEAVIVTLATGTKERSRTGTSETLVRVSHRVVQETQTRDSPVTKPISSLIHLTHHPGDPSTWDPSRKSLLCRLSSDDSFRKSGSTDSISHPATSPK